MAAFAVVFAALAAPAAAGELTKDSAGQAANPDSFADYAWYKWTFDIDPTLDAVGEQDGRGEFYLRVFAPETAAGETYPLVANLGGLGNDGNLSENFYARSGVALWSNPALQEKYPSYVMSMVVPFEASVNYEAEMVYMHEIGEAIRALSEEFGDVDVSRIYATGMSQGAGWSYEAAAAQPDLFAALFINSGTIVHTTWGDQIDIDTLMDVGLYIVHGTDDVYIPVNEAYRVYNALRQRGKTNLRLDVVAGGHVLVGTDFLPTSFPDMPPLTQVYPWQDWMFAQKKGEATEEGRTLYETVPFEKYQWAGVQALQAVATWATDLPYANWIEPSDNATWATIKDSIAVPTVEGTSTGDWMVGRFRIGDETQTTFDDSDDPATATIGKGQTLAMTIQGYTGAYGDDLAAFEEEWDVDWAILEGEVTAIELTTAASDEPIARPERVNLTNGGGPNKNNSLATDNVLDGEQVYLKVSLADDYSGDRLKLAVRFTRDLGTSNFGSEEFASYWHVVDLAVD